MGRFLTTGLVLGLLAGNAGGRENSVFTALENVKFAEQLSGPDLGAKINAADAELGSSAGEIWVSSSGTLTTQVSLSSNHTLKFLGNITINVPLAILIPRTSTNVHIACSGSGSTLINTQTGYNGSVYGYATIQIGGIGTYDPTAYDYITSDLAAGTTIIPLNSSAGFAPGQDVLFQDGRSGIVRFTEWNLVDSIPDGTHVALKYPTEHAYKASYPMRMGGFGAGTLAKFWSVEGCHFSSTTTAPGASGSGPAVDVGIATDGKVLDNWIDNMGSRGILIGNSGYPSGRVIVSRNHIRNAGLVPLGGGSPSLEVYGGSHVTVSDNQVWDANSAGIQIHGFHHVISGNQVWFTRNGDACYSLDTAESVTLSNNLASECSGNGFQMFGAPTENSTEAQHITFMGNSVQDAGGDGFSIGTAGSPGYVRAILVGNFAYRCRGANGGFVFYGTPRGGMSHLVSGNWSEGNKAAGFAVGTPHLSLQMMGNYSQNNARGFSLNSPMGGVFSNNADASSGIPLVLGTAVGSIFLGNAGMGNFQGSIDPSSVVLAMPDAAGQVAKDTPSKKRTTVFEHLPQAATEGEMIFCSDCATSKPCRPSGSGAMARRIGSVWACN